MSTGRRAYDLLRGYVNRELDRIRGVDMDRQDAVAELNETMNRNEVVPSGSVQSGSSLSDHEHAMQILGLDSGADFATIRRTFERLDRRSDPSNFPEGSVERLQAAELKRRVQWAYHVLTKDATDVQKRFGSLEI